VPVHKGKFRQPQICHECGRKIMNPDTPDYQFNNDKPVCPQCIIKRIDAYNEAHGFDEKTVERLFTL